MEVKEVRKILREDFNKKYRLKTEMIGRYRYGSFYQGDKLVMGYAHSVYAKTVKQKHQRLWNLYQKLQKEGLHATDGDKVII